MGGEREGRKEGSRRKGQRKRKVGSLGNREGVSEGTGGGGGPVTLML